MLTIKTPERPRWQRSGVFIVKFEHVIAGWRHYTLNFRSSNWLYRQQAFGRFDLL